MVVNTCNEYQTVLIYRLYYRRQAEVNQAARNHINFFFSFSSDETTGEFVEVEGTWYFIDKDAKTIDDAYSACSGMSGKLWEPNTLDIMNGVHAEVLTLGLENVGIWVGITDEGSLHRRLVLPKHRRFLSF